MRQTALARPTRRRPGGLQAVARGDSVPPPVGGWDAISPLANMQPDRAVQLDNWFPQPGYVEIRKGFVEHSDTTEATPVESLMAYHGATASADRLFAAANDTIYDVTTDTPASAVTPLNNVRFQHVNIATSGGKFLWVCNGADTPRYYDGSTWSSVTITGITAANIISVNEHLNRLWFVLKDSTKAAYLPVDSIQGAATEFDLGGVFDRGGYLVAMGTWSVDGGDGPEDYAAFVSSKGQVAIYTGIDPDSATTWQLKGVYLIGPPIGRRCFTRVGADLAIISIDGVLPISRALVVERGAAISVALTANIQPVMAQAARDWAGNFGWQLISYPRGTRAILNVPALEGSSQQQYVMNTVTGGWCRFLAQQANCWEVFQDQLFFGGNAGIVYKADVGGSDDGDAITATLKTAFNYFGQRGNQKRWSMCRPILTTDGQISPGISFNVDFADDATFSTPDSSITPGAQWDQAVWDSDVWPADELTTADWTTVSGIGYCASIGVRVNALSTGGPDLAPTLRVNGFDVLYETGAFI